MDEHEISPAIAISPQKGEKWMNIILIIFIVIVIIISINYIIKSSKDLNEKGKYYCEQNNDTFVSMEGRSLKVTYCNNSIINQNGDVIWRKEA